MQVEDRRDVLLSRMAVFSRVEADFQRAGVRVDRGVVEELLEWLRGRGYVGEEVA